MIKGSASMALESNGNNVVWLNATRPDQIQQHVGKDDPLRIESTEDQSHLQQTQHHRYQRNLIKIPNQQSQQVDQPVKCSMFTQTEQTNSFTQTEQSNSGYAEQRQPQQQATMFDPQQIQQQQPAQGQQSQQQGQQMQYVTEKKEEKTQQQATTAEFPFYYNVNMLQKVQTNTVSTIGAITTDDKGCYRFDVQPVGYNTLLNQMSLAAATNAATFKCDICGLVFGHLSLLNHHKRLHNSTPSNLQQPQQVVVQAPTTVTVATTPERPYTCDACGACFALPGELKSHKTNMHQKPKVQVCEECGSEDPCEHHPTKVKKTIKPGHHPVKRRGVTSVTKCHKCNGTGIIFIGKDDEKLDSGLSSLAKCSGCKATGRIIIGSGKQNQNQPEKPFHCNVCDGTFSRYSSLWSHKRLHSGDKPFKCEVCGLAFAKAAYLKNHGRVHTGEKPFKCSVCGMQFSQSPHLKNHERIHSGERPYQCEVCEKTFARHSTLWNHRRIHTGEKPYRCNTCGSAFNQATHLKNHAKVHTGEKPHRCDICEIGFSDRFALKRHRAIHEKYGQTARNQNANSASNSQQPNTSNPQQQQQPNTSNPQQSQQAQQQPQPQQQTQPGQPQVVVVNATTPVTVSQGQGQAVMLDEWAPEAAKWSSRG
ncbi:zinc finger protein 260 isoform X1 [Diachasma alloeum]|uniref:zinc finger protein 260 isoform X1 n=1 Tax=Diachasma alloeum TaxID=454923 RepID=UPI0007381531|nr:zinc finger protein 260 isoform X1 [Diachasma alloeum]